MTKTTEFISELVRAANEVEKQTDFERKRLLENAVIIIQHLAAELGHPHLLTTADAVFSLHSVSTAVTLGWASDVQVRVALLDAATVIREMRVELEDRVAVAAPGCRSPDGRQ